ncbi:Aste57867_22480 [Aphanomyces stellatus]|uniref:Aste57867_22480 protein n=1 Tax=Aphanomyces stellatus TaxID=120398 RepID=A0A485LK83_9STRA|nr:hypothetical protein As57867_022410 [Aphanomyces stellatus]VFT99140.1 Aste57867_22480 [Aphanomyces stellatus]
MTQRPVMYSMGKSSCCWRVRAVLAHKGIEYDNVIVNTFTNENKNEAYRRINPNQKIPSLAIDGHVLTQSIAMIEYLEETHPTPPLLPADAVGRAHVRAIVDLIGADIQPIQSLSVLREISKDAAADEQPARMQAWATKWIARGFEALEAHLQTTAGTYCFGETLTLADVYLLPQVNNARIFKMDLAAFPTILRIAATLDEESMFKSTHPSTLNDNP